MPTYSVKNNDTGEVKDVFMSYSSLQDYLKENPNMQSVITQAPGLSSGGNIGALQRAGDGWKEVQDKIKSGLPPRLKDNIRTK